MKEFKDKFDAAIKGKEELVKKAIADKKIMIWNVASILDSSATKIEIYGWGENDLKVLDLK